MAYPIEDKFVIAVASSALFDLKESDQVFQEQGEEKYRIFQRDNEHKILNKGVACDLFRYLCPIIIYQNSEGNKGKVLTQKHFVFI